MAHILHGVEKRVEIVLEYKCCDCWYMLMWVFKRGSCCSCVDGIIVVGELYGLVRECANIIAIKYINWDGCVWQLGNF